jgi:hypothetical protein
LLQRGVLGRPFWLVHGSVCGIPSACVGCDFPCLRSGWQAVLRGSGGICRKSGFLGSWP